MTQHFTKKIDNNYVMWFEQSNRWMHFEEPAWFVDKLYQKGINSYEISHKCAKKYNLSQPECLSFVNEICIKIAELSKPASDSTADNNSSLIYSDYSFVPYSTRYYLIGSKRFALNFETRIAEYYIHPPLTYLETGNFGEVDIHFEIYCKGNHPVLMEKNRPETTSSFEDFNRLKKRLFITMVNTIYNKTDNDWMSFVHASALTDGKQTLLLSSASGSGKSSMAALLQTKGLQLVSDDFVPIDAKNKRAFPFPAAISVKEGAFPLLSPFYGNLTDKNFNSYEYTHRSVRYLPLKSSGLEFFKARPVRNIIFIRYNAKVSCNFSRVPSNEALKLFHAQSWVSGNPHHAKAFINWFVQMRCFSLEYGDTEEGMNKVLGVFER